MNTRALRARLLPLTAALALSPACGGQGAATLGLPEPEPCPTTMSAATTVSTYFGNLNRGQEELRKLSTDFLTRWPTRKFSRADGFREDLARTSDSSVCVAERLVASRPADARYEAYDTAVDQVLAAYIDSMKLGREAARSRNVSKYREWLAAVDALPGQLTAAREKLPAR